MSDSVLHLPSTHNRHSPAAPLQEHEVIDQGFGGLDLTFGIFSL